MDTPPFDYIFLGAGLSGLVAAHQALTQKKRILILEKKSRTGGVVESSWNNGFLLEHGPNTVQATPELLTLAQNLGLENNIRFSPPHLPRYILSQGQLEPVPMSPLEFFQTPLLTFGGKLRLLMEPFMMRRKKISDETLGSFARRRLGTQVADTFLAPFVSGVWAGDMNELSAQSAFPLLYEWEQKNGSLFRGALAHRKKINKNKKIPKKGFLSFQGGLQTLTNTLTQKLAIHLQLNAHTRKIIPPQQGKNPLWTVQVGDTLFQCRHVHCSLPSYEAAQLVQSFSFKGHQVLSTIPYASLAVLHITAPLAEVRHDTTGFGFLVRPQDQRSVLGCIFNHALFENRAPTGHALFTIFMGGARFPQVMDQPDEKLFEEAVHTLQLSLGLKKTPTLLSLKRHKKAIPQYTLGHEEKMASLQKLENEWPGLHFSGNYRQGISVGDVVKNSLKLIQA